MIAFGIIPTMPATARADITEYQKTKIEEDLADFGTGAFPKDELGDLQVVRFQEYCYSNVNFYEMYYGLYVYIYNPTGKPLDTAHGVSALNMATAYNTEGEPSSYDNMRLTYCDATDNYLFYKFYVADSVTLLSVEKTYAAQHEGTRRYDIAGIQLKFIGDKDEVNTQTEDRCYGYTYYFKGFAKGCDANNPTSESTLECEMTPLETLQLDVRQTNWRTGDYKDYVCDELNSVYFSVDDKYFDDYGNLQKIKAEWYEYKTRPMFVTSDENAEAGFQDYIGKDIGEQDKSLPWTVLWEEKVHSAITEGDVTTWHCGRVYNKYSEKTLNPYVPNYYYSENVKTVSRMDWFFYRPNAKSNADFEVTKDEVVKYAKEYSATASGDKIQGANGAYSLQLFEDSIDADRVALVQKHNPTATAGYVCEEIDAGDLGSLTVKKDQSWWDKLWHGVQYTEKGYDPIVVLDKTSGLDSLDAAAFADKYLVNSKDAETIFADVKDRIKNGKKVVLFRFAVTDYYASTARFEYVDNNSMSDQDGYVAQETAFLNFDVISLTFRGEQGNDTVIACVSNPIDIFNGLDAPPTLDIKTNWWEKLLAEIVGFLKTLMQIILLVFLVFALVALITVGAPVLKVVWGVICIPFKAIGKLCKALFKKKK